MKSIQFCPKCLSTNIKESDIVPVGDPLKKVGLFGWDCLECNYTGKDFFIVDEKDYLKLIKKKKRK
tara:strand:- start:416 stop:613 length:198 start_codon:yes stop_codon:yes gene_type:complete